ncbi:NADAR family protein [Teredinibacter sp. KSP-S5-2]|uniref:NADAR family protein n=1 Tax=Teredinibacter sp. KSP-S5-2 TaxID=3034506 RepID=UPI0029346E98|nr:NADAR family protein [Teredinibacter sp. KSP-S5-2]WNO10882.1 NADAR family protein [Teredinibacter sp. KSP-S5-2]
MRETEEFYFFWKHQFGQWTKRDIVDPEGVKYNCCEQYMMYKKALLFGDMETASKILSEPEPAVQQKLGREVKRFQSGLWNLNKIGIVWYGNYLKFSQHADLSSRLIDTGSKVLAEASPYDLVWGVGFSADDDLILDEKNWRGKNLLGKVLMSVRDAIKLA